jgi:hypothetical protein
MVFGVFIETFIFEFAASKSVTLRGGIATENGFENSILEVSPP